MLGIMPTGYAPGSATPVVSLFWSLHSERFAAWHSAGLNAWKDQVRAISATGVREQPNPEPLLAQITDASQLTWARYMDVVMPRYHAGNVVVIGDAAHATSPQLGQGTNLALMDAVALAQCVAQHSDVPTALAQYSAQRKGHLHFYSQASRFLTPWFQSDHRLLPWLRDTFMAFSNHLPVMGSLSRQTLVGVRTGWLGGQVPLAPIVAKAA
jgi:2-polyprenyl-6-methoxyphenol hydroxylase-like FAD-dependent oxidoreductase